RPALHGAHGEGGLATDRSSLARDDTERANWWPVVDRHLLVAAPRFMRRGKTRTLDLTGNRRIGMTQLREELALITAKTLKHYNERATEFWEGTRDHDVQQNVEALLRHIRGSPPLRLLDFGCGPGRDLATFRALGHE